MANYTIERADGSQSRISDSTPVQAINYGDTMPSLYGPGVVVDILGKAKPEAPTVESPAVCCEHCKDTTWEAPGVECKRCKVYLWKLDTFNGYAWWEKVQACRQLDAAELLAWYQKREPKSTFKLAARKPRTPKGYLNPKGRFNCGR